MVKFKCLVEGVAETMPITPAKELKSEWLEKAKKTSLRSLEAGSIARCPGISGLRGLGWVQRTYQDILLETNGDGESFTARTRSDQKNTPNGSFITNYVDSHSPEIFSDFYDLGEGVLRSIVKIQSPWFIEIPKGFSALLLPIPYSDERRFTVAPGLLTKSDFLNVQLYWRVLKGVELIPAGTPLHQIVLVQNSDSMSEVEFLPDAEPYMRKNYYCYQQHLAGKR